MFLDHMASFAVNIYNWPHSTSPGADLKGPSIMIHPPFIYIPYPITSIPFHADEVLIHFHSSPAL